MYRLCLFQVKPLFIRTPTSLVSCRQCDSPWTLQRIIRSSMYFGCGFAAQIRTFGWDFVCYSPNSYRSGKLSKKKYVYKYFYNIDTGIVKYFLFDHFSCYA